MPEQITGGIDTQRKLRVCIKSFGCQMNEYDSEVAAGLLEAAGYKIVQNSKTSSVIPAKAGIQSSGSPIKAFGDDKEENADVYLMNTCSVREHAEDRVYGRLGMLGKIKRENPNLIVGLMGCMVEEHREKLFKRFPSLDLMIGTRNIKELPALIDEVRRSRKQVAQIKQDGISIEYTDQIKRRGTFHAWLPIMTGCDKVCTYCIVPKTRGSEVSMPVREVYREASRLASEGVKWITLLGQNVNSYRGDVVQTVGADPRVRPESKHGPAHGSAPTSVSFPQLLEMLCEIEGLDRISFTTSHPSDATEELFQVIARNSKISRRFHLPLQSGSDRVLKRMKRLHTIEHYRAQIDRLRSLVPGISVTTDLISGFSGETEEDHQATLEAMRQIRFDSAFMYKYSLRPGTPAAKLKDDVTPQVKAARHAELLALQKTITRENRELNFGKTVTVCVEERSSRDPRRFIGRTDQDQKMVFEVGAPLVGARAYEPGDFVRARITGLVHETYVGESPG